MSVLCPAFAPQDRNGSASSGGVATKGLLVEQAADPEGPVWGAPQVKVPTHNRGEWMTVTTVFKGGGDKVGSGEWKHGQVGVTKLGICTLPFQKRGQPAACGPTREFASGEYQECESCCVIPKDGARQQPPSMEAARLHGGAEV